MGTHDYILFSSGDGIYCYDNTENAIMNKLELADDNIDILELCRMELYGIDVLFALTQNGRVLNMMYLDDHIVRDKSILRLGLPHNIHQMVDGWDANMKKVLYCVSNLADVYQFIFKMSSEGASLVEYVPIFMIHLSELENASFYRLFQREGMWHAIAVLENASVIWVIYDVEFSQVDQIDITPLFQTIDNIDSIVDFQMVGCLLIITTLNRLYLFNMVLQKCERIFEFEDEEHVQEICFHNTPNNILLIHALVYSSKKDILYMVVLTLDGERIHNVAIDTSLLTSGKHVRMWSYKDQRYNTIYPQQVFCLPVRLYKDYLKNAFHCLENPDTTSNHGNNVWKNPQIAILPFQDTLPNKYSILLSRPFEQYANITHEDVLFKLYGPYVLRANEQSQCFKLQIHSYEYDRVIAGTCYYELIKDELCNDNSEQKQNVSYKLYYNQYIRQVCFIRDTPLLVKLIYSSQEYPFRYVDVCLSGKRDTIMAVPRHPMEKSILTYASKNMGSSP